MNFLKNIALDLQIGFFLAAIAAAYWYWIRPILRERPELKAFYERTDSVWAAVRLKFQGLKGNLMTALAKATVVVVAVHDTVIPYITQVDWTPITSQVPDILKPVILFGAFWFIGEARKWAEQRA